MTPRCSPDPQLVSVTGVSGNVAMQQQEEDLCFMRKEIHSGMFVYNTTPQASFKLNYMTPFTFQL